MFLKLILVFSLVSNTVYGYCVYKESVKKNSTYFTKDEYLKHCDKTKRVNEQFKESCCMYETDRFSYSWPSGDSYLTTYLATLQAWGCQEFEFECKYPTFKMNKFTKLIYMQFCRPDKFQTTCANQVSKLRHIPPLTNNKSRHNSTSSSTAINIAIPNFHANNLSVTDLQEPCVGATIFGQVGVGRFYEIIQPHIPFCGLVWTGVDISSASRLRLSSWNFMSIWCKGSIIFCMVLISIIALAIIFANGTVIAVFILNPKLRNSQYYYKLSLAIADLLVGIIVFPTLIYSQFIEFITHREKYDVVKNSLFPETNFSFVSTKLPKFYDGKTSNRWTYYNSIGFFTTLSLFVSVYTLMVAALDRFMAIYLPLKYNRTRAIKRAQTDCVILWIVAIAVSTVPFYSRTLRYYLIATLMVTSSGSDSLYFLVVAFLIPLVIVWVLSGLTFYHALKHSQRRNKLTHTNPKTSIEIRLARTLFIMVGVFSACVIPIIINLLIPMFASGITFTLPCDLNLESANVSNSSEYCIIILFMTNSLWNVFIYSGRNKSFREATIAMYKRLSHKVGCNVVGHAARTLIINARKFSLPTSNSLSSDRKNSGPSLVTDHTNTKRPSTDATVSSERAASEKRTTNFSNNPTPSSSTVKENKYQKRSKKHEKIEDSSFGSFVVDAGANRLFESVMDKIEEDQIDIE